MVDMTKYSQFQKRFGDKLLAALGEFTDDFQTAEMRAAMINVMLMNVANCYAGSAGKSPSYQELCGVVEAMILKMHETFGLDPQRN